MDDKQLLSLLQERESSSAQFVWGTLAQERRRSVREYYRLPYGTEVEGWSDIVTSEVQDTVEWILPDLVEMFLSSDDAVEFEPTEADDAEYCQQATDTVNHVFRKMNDGFLVLTTAFKDALQIKTGAIHWRKEKKRIRKVITLENVSALELAAQSQEDDKIEGQDVTLVPAIDQMTGQPVFNLDGTPAVEERFTVRISRVVEKKCIKVEAFQPDNLLVQRDWSSMMLADCPYVNRNMEVTLSDLHEMGFKDVEAKELAASIQPGVGDAEDQRQMRRGLPEEADLDREAVETADESQTKGWLRIEWVLADFDGDGIAERREVYRLADKVLSNEECDEVPISIGSPILVQHRWDGMSIAEIVSDLQVIKTELTRSVLNNAYLANNPRKTVLIDKNGAPMADIDDVLDGQPGDVIRVRQPDALGGDLTPFVGNQMFPLLEYIDSMGEKRTGVSKMQQGIDPNALRTDRTAYEAGQLTNAAKQRVKLIARMLGETLVKPMFKGILHLLTEGDMEPIAFRLRGRFVKYDPNDWRDGYDATVNVGLGTGDTDKQMLVLGNIAQTQLMLAQSPLGEMMVTPKQIYNTQAKRIALGGFKNVGEYLKDPGDAPMPKKPEGPPPEVLIEQMKQQTAMARIDREAQIKEREAQNNFALQQQNDERDAARERAKAEYDYQLELARIAEGRYKTDKDNAARVTVAKISHPESILPPGWGVDPETGAVVEGPDPFQVLMAGMETINAKIDAPAALVRDPATGAVVGVAKGGQVRPIVRDEAGRVVGHH
ncbi:hypothetical protein RA8CHR_04920 [Variovorax sp. RA8]|nr:hypothetical protein RA8CHR_04920 [Variovorax sp. RA8]